MSREIEISGINRKEESKINSITQKYLSELGLNNEIPKFKFKDNPKYDDLKRKQIEIYILEVMKKLDELIKFPDNNKLEENKKKFIETYNSENIEEENEGEINIKHNNQLYYENEKKIRNYKWLLILLLLLNIIIFYLIYSK